MCTFVVDYMAARIYQNAVIAAALAALKSEAYQEYAIRHSPHSLSKPMQTLTLSCSMPSILLYIACVSSVSLVCCSCPAEAEACFEHGAVCTEDVRKIVARSSDDDTPIELRGNETGELLQLLGCFARRDLEIELQPQCFATCRGGGDNNQHGPCGAGGGLGGDSSRRCCQEEGRYWVDASFNTSSKVRAL